MRTQATVLVAALGAAALAVQDAPAQTPDVPTVAVMDFSGLMLGESGNSVNLGKAVTAMLVTEFSGREGIRVIERANLQDLLEEQRLALTGRVDESSAIEIGRIVGAQYVLHGAVVNLGTTLRMDIRAVDVETSEVIAVMKKMDQTSALLGVIVSIADDFSNELNLTPPSERPAIEPIPTMAIIEYSRAVDFEDRGESDQAAQHYQAALDIYPNHRDAQRALARIRGGGS